MRRTTTREIELSVHRIVANGIEIGYLDVGEGDPVLLFHGFPDVATTFLPLIEVLCESGYRCIAPWLRGYAPTAAGRYFDQGTLLADALGLIEALALAEVRVVGHDWGADIAYGLGSASSARVTSLAALSVPHTKAIRRNRSRDFDQLRRSFYIWLFLAGDIADSLVPADDWQFIRRLWQEWSPDWRPDEAHLQEVIDSLQCPGGLRAALGYYRAVFDERLQDASLRDLRLLVETGPVKAPTLLIMGSRDGCIGPEMASGAEVAFSGPYSVETLGECGHFLHMERPVEVGTRIADWFGRY